MDSDLRTEDLLIQLRAMLKVDQIKLWLPPYFQNSTGSCENEMKALSERYCVSMNIDADCCLRALKLLQANACERLRERERFQDTGVATLKVRLPGASETTSLPIRLSASVLDLQESVAKLVGTEAERIKLIWNGQVLQKETQLSCVGLHNGALVMAVILNENSKDLEEVEAQYRMLKSTKADAKLLAGSTDHENVPYLQIADQSGKTLELPPAERKALIVAMSLHEKGRAAMKDENYALALVIFLGADREFSRCRSRLLESVDNYALLNLDIAWCYLCLKNVTQIPDAEKRLRQCEQSFHRSYGTNLERLMAIKGTTGNESALFMRLHLLQAIILFHQNKRQEAAVLFQRAETELAGLKVSDTSLSTLLELGFTATEARLGLRATNGDINAAAERITSQRQERKQLAKKEREQQRLGRCIDDQQWVDPQLHTRLISMGYSSNEARIALRMSNNDLNSSLQMLQDKEALMQTAYRKFHVNPEWIDQVVAVGFDRRMAKAALKKYFGDIEKAVEELVTNGGIVDGVTCNDSDDAENVEGETEASGSVSGQSSSSGTPVESSRKNQRDEAAKRLAEGLSAEEDHLDLTLALEEEFLQQYLSLL